MTHAELAKAFHENLAPEGPIEELCVTEIVNAAWRLRRCAEVTETLDIADPKQVAIDRAQAHAHRTIERFLAELRRLQTARLIRGSVADEAAVEELPVAGIPDYRQLVRILDATARLRMTTRRLHGVETIEKVIHNCVPKPEPAQPEPEKLASFCKKHVPAPSGAAVPRTTKAA
jgi:hypothetical protein